MTPRQRRVVFSLVVAAVFLVPLVRQLDIETIRGHIYRIDPPLFISGLLVLAAANLLRSLRFSVLDNRATGISRWWIINSLYNALTATLPGGVGEAVTAAAIKKALNYDFLMSLRLLVISRVMDLLGISILLLTSSMLLRTGLWGNLALGIACITLLISAVSLVPATERVMIQLLHKLLSGKGRIAGRVAGKLEGLAVALEEKRNDATRVLALGYSLLMIACSAFSVHLVLNSLGMDFSWLQSFYCFGVYAVFQLVPIQGFAGVGTQAAWWMLALTAAGYGKDDAAAMGVILHGTFYLFIAVLAGLTLAGWRLSAISGPKE